MTRRAVALLGFGSLGLTRKFLSSTVMLDSPLGSHLRVKMSFRRKASCLSVAGSGARFRFFDAFVGPASVTAAAGVPAPRGGVVRGIATGAALLNSPMMLDAVAADAAFSLSGEAERGSS